MVHNPCKFKQQEHQEEWENWRQNPRSFVNLFSWVMVFTLWCAWSILAWAYTRVGPFPHLTINTIQI